MRAITYRVPVVSDALVQQLYQVSAEDATGISDVTSGSDSGSSIEVIPSYQRTAPAVWSYLWAQATDVPVIPEAETINPWSAPIRFAPAWPTTITFSDGRDESTVVIAEESTSHSWRPRALTVPHPSTTYLFTPAGDVPTVAEVPAEPTWVARKLATSHPSTSYLFSSTDVPAQAAQAETTPGWTPSKLRALHPSTAYLFTPPQDTSIAGETPTEVSWTPRPFARTLPATDYLFAKSPTEAPADIAIWRPRPLWRPRLAVLPSLLMAAASDVPAAAPAVDTFQPWRRFQTFQPAWPTTINFSDGRDESIPVPQPDYQTWARPRPFRPAYPPVVSLTGIKGDTPPVPPPVGERSDLSWAPSPLEVPKPNLRAAKLLYYRGVAEDFGESPANQWLTFWDYHTQYEDKVRQFFLRHLQGQPPQDLSIAVPAGGLPMWRPLSMRQPKTPVAAFSAYYFTGESNDVSTPIVQGEPNPWTAQFIKTPATPRSIITNLYFTGEAQDDNAAVEAETNPQWTQRFTRPTPVTRAAFIGYYNTGEDTSQNEETQQVWTPRPLWDAPTPISAFFKHYLSGAPQDDNAPVDSIQSTWRPYLINQPLSPGSFVRLYLWSSPANAEQSAEDQIGLNGWVPRPLAVRQVAKAATMYYRSDTAQDTDAPPPPPPPVGARRNEYPDWLRRARLLLYHP